MGGDVGQGYDFGRLMEAGEMERLLGDELAATRTAATSD